MSATNDPGWPTPLASSGSGASLITAAGRETDDVSDFPPPPPGAHPSNASVAAGGATTGGSGSSDWDWDWDRAKALAEKWFRPLAEPEGWAALGYLFFSAVASPFLFAAMMAFGGVTFGLLFLIVGFLLIVPFFRVVEILTSVERRFAELAGHEIEPRPTKPLTGIGPKSFMTALSDPVRWRHVAFIVVNLVMAPLLFAFGSIPASIVLQAVTGGSDLVGTNFGFGTVQFASVGLLSLPIAALFAGAIPRVAIWMAGLKAEVDSWFLGTDRLAVAEERVTTLSGQRQDILDAVASERRRIERNLHDGVQQQLVAIGLDLGMAENQLAADPERARELLGHAREKVQGSIGELRQLGRGLHPAILEDRGIDAALSAVVSGSPIPISVHVDPDLDLSTDVAETVYFVANEAIANVLKHAKARVASVHVTRIDQTVRVTVHDDGVGGANPSGGTGLAGIRARVHAVDGTLAVASPNGGPTTIVAEVPRQAGRSRG